MKDFKNVNVIKDYQKVEFAAKILLEHSKRMSQKKEFNDLGLYSEGSSYELLSIAKKMKRSGHNERNESYDLLLVLLADCRDSLYGYEYCFENGLIASPEAVIESMKNEIIKLRKENKK